VHYNKDDAMSTKSPQNHKFINVIVIENVTDAVIIIENVIVVKKVSTLLFVAVFKATLLWSAANT